MNVSRETYFVCYQHRTKWLAAFDVFKSWKRENEEIWRENGYRLAEFMTVDPLPPAPDEYPPPDRSNPLRGCDVNGLPLDPNHPWNRK